MHRSLPLKIIATFYIQGWLNLALDNYSWVLKRFYPKKTQLKVRIDSVLEEFVFGTTAARYTLCIAAFSQLSSITTYHLFLCYTLVSALSTVQNELSFLTLSRQQNPSDRILGFYYFGIELLEVTMNCLLIYRLASVWDNTGGKCFIISIGGNGSLAERDDALLWLYINLVWGFLAQLIFILADWSRWSEHWGPQDPEAKLMLTILFYRVPDNFWYIWNLHWTIKLTIANQSLIDDNEYNFGFGQVGALVTLCLSVCRGYISYKGA